MKVIIHVPCPTYIRKYIEASFGSNYEIKQTDWLGIFIYSLLQKKSHPTYHYAGHKKTAVYNDHLVFNFSIHQANKHGFFLINSDELKIVKEIDDIFRRNMYSQAIINFENFGIEYQSTIMAYLESFNITEDDLHYETIRKDFNRLKNNIIKN